MLVLKLLSARACSTTKTILVYTILNGKGFSLVVVYMGIVLFLVLMNASGWERGMYVLGQGGLWDSDRVGFS